MSDDKKMPTISAGKGIAAILPRTLDETFRLAQLIGQSGLAPYGLNSPQKITVALMTGLELGLPPMKAISNIAVINGKPCIYGDALIGIIRATPDCLYVKEWVEGEGDDMVAYCKTHRKDEPEPVEDSFSVADAKRAGLWQTEATVKRKNKSGAEYEKENDSPWYKYPKRMLRMRARAFCLRDTYADHLMGVGFREEVEDYSFHQHVGPDNAKDVTPTIDRLREANEGKTQTEGFDLNNVTQEVDTAKGGENSAGGDVNSFHPADDAGGGSDEVGTDVIDLQANVGDEEPSDEVPPPAEDEPDDPRLKDTVAQMMYVANRQGHDFDARAKQLSDLNKFWTSNLNKETRERHLKAIYSTAMQVSRGGEAYDTSIDFYAEMLGVEVEELERIGKEAIEE